MTGGWMRATSPSGEAAYEGVIQWTADLGAGTRAAEAGQNEGRNDEATGSKPLRRAFAKHLQPDDVPSDLRGLSGRVNEMKAKLPKRLRDKL